MHTVGVKNLVEMVLSSLPRPHTEDVIEDVFVAIEQSADWLQEYQYLCIDLGKNVVNTWGGHWIANSEGKLGREQVSSKRSKLIGSYSKLTGLATTANGKRSESEARRLMSAYYQEHKNTLPAHVRNNRDLIVNLLIDGASPEQAFSLVSIVP